MLIDCDADGLEADVPPDVRPWKYIVPSPPFEAVTVVLPQNTPPPLVITAAGSAFTVILAVAIHPVDNV